MSFDLWDYALESVASYNTESKVPNKIAADFLSFLQAFVTDLKTSGAINNLDVTSGHGRLRIARAGQMDRLGASYVEIGVAKEHLANVTFISEIEDARVHATTSCSKSNAMDVCKRHIEKLLTD